MLHCYTIYNALYLLLYFRFDKIKIDIFKKLTGQMDFVILLILKRPIEMSAPKKHTHKYGQVLKVNSCKQKHL